MLTKLRPATWRRWTCVALIGASLFGGWIQSTLAAGKQGMVRTKFGNQTYVGEVDETQKDVVTVKQANGKLAEINKQNVQFPITYFDTEQDEFEARMSALQPKDTASRLSLARWALARKQPQWAAQALDSVRQYDPKNVELAALDKQVATMQPPPATLPAASQPVVVAPDPVQPSKGPARRLLTADEVQFVRRREMKQNESLRYQVSPAARKRVVESGIATPAELRGIEPNALAALILARGTDEMKREVKIVSDPVSLLQYRTTINRLVVGGCAAANCHGSEKSGSRLVLFPRDTEEAALTNFVILSDFTSNRDGVTYSMIDRFQPLNSLLLAYALPENQTRTPHPAVSGFKPMVRTNADPAFTAMFNWIRDSLNVQTPSYEDIDLTKEAPAPPARPGTTR